MNSHPGFRSPRCILFFPGSRPELYEKAIGTRASAVCMDLEDAVAPEDKGEARSAALSILERPDRDAGRLIVRINHPSTSDGEADLATIENAARSLGPSVALMMPKTDSGAELDTVRDRLGRSDLDVSFIPIIETVGGLARAPEIAAADSVAGVLFGGLDLSLDLGAALAWEPLLYARSRFVHAARIGGVPAIDMPFLDISDSVSAGDEAIRVRRLGFTGKAAIHPDHVDAVLDAFAPTEEEVAHARRVTEASERERTGAFSLDGEMVDRPVIEAARRILSWADEGPI